MKKGLFFSKVTMWTVVVGSSGRTVDPAARQVRWAAVPNDLPKCPCVIRRRASRAASRDSSFLSAGSSQEEETNTTSQEEEVHSNPRSELQDFIDCNGLVVDIFCVFALEANNFLAIYYSQVSCSVPVPELGVF